jgi:hypothetical protein
MRFSRRSLINGLLGTPLFIFTRHGFAYQRAQAKCTKVTLKLTLTAGQSYEQRIGGNLTLKVMPSNRWMFSLEDAAGHDYIAPVNPPLRYNPMQTLGLDTRCLLRSP